MADHDMTKNSDTKANQTMQREQGNSETGSNRQREQGGMDKERQEKSAIGGQARSDEQLTNKNRESDKSDCAPTGQR